MSRPALFNPNPTLFGKATETSRPSRQANRSLWHDPDEELDEEDSQIDGLEIFDLIRSINDPELPHTLEDLAVVTPQGCTVVGNDVNVVITPTQPHCGAASFIGLAIIVKLQRSLPPRFRVRLSLKEGSYYAPDALCKQLNDKERVAAAIESEAIMKTLETMLESAHGH